MRASGGSICICLLNKYFVAITLPRSNRQRNAWCLLRKVLVSLWNRRELFGAVIIRTSFWTQQSLYTRDKPFQSLPRHIGSLRVLLGFDLAFLAGCRFALQRSTSPMSGLCHAFVCYICIMSECEPVDMETNIKQLLFWIPVQAGLSLARPTLLFAMNSASRVRDS